MNNVRVRFAPSPTGPLHIGGVRTALFNYLFAKKHNGTFVLRIEDTDQTRYVANAEEYIAESLKWCGIPYEEGPDKNEKYGPYRQSERKEIYKKYADELIKKQKAYYAFDTPEELDSHRKNNEKEGKTFTYNWNNRNQLKNSLSLSEKEVEAKLKAGEKYVIRFKTPEARTLKMYDEIREEIQIDTNVLDDKILFKSDGMPTYHLANIVDDHLMKITHVIRGEEWLPSMPLHVLLYEAFGWEAPKFAHLPLILKPVGKGKLSKRDGDKMGFPVFPLQYTDEKTQETSRGYKEDGYFSEAFINMLALLGWNPGTEQEIFSLSELCKTFGLDRVSKSGAKFSPDKTKWFNQQYLQQKTNEELATLFEPILAEKEIKADKKYIVKVVSLIKERAVFVSDFWELSNFFFAEPQQYDEKVVKKQWKSDTGELLGELCNVIKNIDDFTSENAEKIVKKWISEKQIGFGKVMQPLRLSLVGALKGPHLFDIMAMIGKEKSLQRIHRCIQKF